MSTAVAALGELLTLNLTGHRERAGDARVGVCGNGDGAPPPARREKKFADRRDAGTGTRAVRCERPCSSEGALRVVIIGAR